jgi:putative SOS response-associated peptidase YedK
MCNDYRLEVDAATIAEDFADLKIKIKFSEEVPNIEARADIKITDVAPIGADRRAQCLVGAGRVGGLASKPALVSQPPSPSCTVQTCPRSQTRAGSEPRDRAI